MKRRISTPLRKTRSSRIWLTNGPSLSATPTGLVLGAVNIDLETSQSTQVSVRAELREGEREKSLSWNSHFCSST
ncbi:hypothetical protein J6590_007862 [Homalodisca vitripennis]|nr:hypothetical protein J6590_007862 [Homalodisca vitripennis]